MKDILNACGTVKANPDYSQVETPAQPFLTHDSYTMPGYYEGLWTCQQDHTNMCTCIQTGYYKGLWRTCQQDHTNMCTCIQTGYYKGLWRTCQQDHTNMCTCIQTGYYKGLWRTGQQVRTNICACLYRQATIRSPWTCQRGHKNTRRWKCA